MRDILTLGKKEHQFYRDGCQFCREMPISLAVCDRERGVIDRGAIDVIYKASWLVTPSVKGLLFGLPLLQIGVYWEVKLPNAFGHVALIAHALCYFMHVYIHVSCCCNIYPIGGDNRTDCRYEEIGENYLIGIFFSIDENEMYFNQ